MYALLYLESVKSGNPIDRGNCCTILDDDPVWNEYGIPYGESSADTAIYFGLKEKSGESSFRSARFRSSVGGDILFQFKP